MPIIYNLTPDDLGKIINISNGVLAIKANRIYETRKDQAEEQIIFDFGDEGLRDYMKDCHAVRFTSDFSTKKDEKTGQYYHPYFSDITVKSVPKHIALFQHLRYSRENLSFTILDGAGVPDSIDRNSVVGLDWKSNKGIKNYRLNSCATILDLGFNQAEIDKIDITGCKSLLFSSEQKKGELNQCVSPAITREFLHPEQQDIQVSSLRDQIVKMPQSEHQQRLKKATEAFNKLKAEYDALNYKLGHGEVSERKIESSQKYLDILSKFMDPEKYAAELRKYIRIYQEEVDCGPQMIDICNEQPGVFDLKEELEETDNNQAKLDYDQSLLFHLEFYFENLKLTKETAASKGMGKGEASAATKMEVDAAEEGLSDIHLSQSSQPATAPKVAGSRLAARKIEKDTSQRAGKGSD